MTEPISGASAMTATTGAKPHPIFLAGTWVESDDPLIVANPADADNPAGATFHATPAQYEQAVEAAVKAFEVTRRLPAYERGAILRNISAGIRARREELGRLIALEAGARMGSVSILPMSRELGDRMVSDDRFKLLTFTGSPSVGWRMKERAGKKRVVLELGGNAGVIIDKTADLDWAVKRCLVGAYAYAGQVCISVQRMFVHEDIWDTFMPKLVEGARALKLGDPLDPQTDVGPMVDGNAASRTQRWVDEALAAGGKALLGGTANGTYFPPTILTDVPVTAAVCSNEAFAPLVVAFKFRAIEDAIRGVTDSMFGL